MKKYYSYYLAAIVFGFLYVAYASISIYIRHMEGYGFSYFNVGDFPNLIMGGISDTLLFGSFSMIIEFILVMAISFVSFTFIKIYFFDQAIASKFKAFMYFSLGILTFYVIVAIFFLKNFTMGIM